MEAKRLRKVNVLGLPFVAEPKQVFLKKHLKPRIDGEQKTFIVTANPEIVMEAYLNKAYFDAIKHATYIVPDGIGIIYAAKINKEKIKERIPGVELVEDCLNYANDNQLSCCFLGASPEVNKRLQVKLKQEYPNIDIKVTRHGYYAQEEEQEIISELVHAEADFNFIALGYPKQEEFIFNNFNQFNKGVFIGVGGSFDVLSGSVKRAPKIFIKFNLEWLYRLLKQPTRLFRSFNLVRFLLTVYFRKKKKGVNMNMKKIKVVSVFGTRPEAIKMAPVVLELEKREEFESITIVTAQHREMLDQILEYFKIVPDYDLNIMSKNQTLADITTHILNKLDPLLKEIRPDILLVHGDTSTTFVAALAAYYNQIPIGHVEAGLRTWNKYSPFPEEMNRQLTSDLADFHFAPTELAATNLLKEDKRKDSIFVTGNTVVDTLNMTVSDRKKRFNKKVLLLTLHRRENIENNVEEIFEAILDILEKNCDVTVIYPMHLNPRIRKKAYKYLGKHPNIKLIEPLDVFEFHNLIAESYLILTDSGGVQEEAPYFGVPVLVLRDTTERPEGIESGVAKLVGTRKNDIINVTNKLLTDKGLYLSMSNSKSPYGDGHATQKILKVIKESYTK